MFSNLKSRVRTVVGVGVIAALVVAGLAFAQNNGGNDDSSAQGGIATAPPPGPPPPGGPMMGGPGGQNLTYAEFHSQQNGQDQVTRLDRGKIDSVSDAEITITENDGNQVTVPVDQDTRVLAPVMHVESSSGKDTQVEVSPGGDEKVTDLQQGQEVLVSHPEDGPADTIMVPPTKAQLRNMPRPPARAFHRQSGSGSGGHTFTLPAPPPGAPQG
jgi:hypothetical protein